MATEPIGHMFCKGDIRIGSGCMRCGRCAVQLAEKVRKLEAAALAAAPVEQQAVEHDGEPSNVELRGMWHGAGGSFHGPQVETGTMPEAKLLPFLRSLIAAQAAQPAAQAEPVPGDFLASVRRLCIAARTTGGTAGRDDGLCAALDQVEATLEAQQASPSDEDMSDEDIQRWCKRYIELGARAWAAEQPNKDSDRYRHLRAKPLDTIKSGGVFAGKIPDNVVLNGIHLDRAIDEEIARAAQAQGDKGGA